MNNLVNIQDGKVVVSSRMVAEKFGKDHKHILRDIELSKERLESNFGLYYEPSMYTASNGKVMGGIYYGINQN